MKFMFSICSVLKERKFGHKFLENFVKQGRDFVDSVRNFLKCIQFCGEDTSKATQVKLRRDLAEIKLLRRSACKAAHRAVEKRIYGCSQD